MKKNYLSNKPWLYASYISLISFLFFSLDLSAQVYTQVFPTTSAPSGWASSNTCNSTSANAAWKFSGSGMGYGVAGTPDHTPGGGTSYMWVDGSSPYPCDVTVTTADIPATVGDELELSFWVRSDNTTTSDNNTLKVDFFDGTTWNNNVYVFSGNNSNWFQATVGLSAYPVTGSGNTKLRFTVSKLSTSSSFYNDIAIDDIEMIALVSCSGPPTAGNVTSSTSSACASQGVTLTLNGVVNANGLSRQWQESTNGINFTDISGAVNTIYSANISAPTYYRVKSICNGTDSVYSDTVFVDLEPFFNCYCSAGATSTTYGYISQTDFADVSYSSPIGCGQQYTATGLTGLLLQGVPYNLASYVNSCTGTTAYSASFKVWIDFNQNGSYSDPGEEIFSQSGTYFQTFGGNFTVPMTALTGATGMRIMVVETSSLGSLNPCYSYTWGEVEDYIVNIQAPPMNDAGISEIVTPTLPYCGGDSVVRVQLMNSGTDTLFNAVINLSINGGTPVTTAWSGVIPPFTTDTNIVVAGINPVGSFNQGDDITVYTTLPNGFTDSLAINDTANLFGLISGLAGVYSIPGDFSSISGAVDTLNMFGTCDTVWFEIASGTYDESIIINEFPRYSPGSPAIFKSATEDSADVIWDNTSNSITIELNGADYIWFEDLTIKNSNSGGNVININDAADYNKVERSHLVGVSINSTSNSNAVIYNQSGIDSYNSYIDNHLENGSYGLYSYGSSSTSLEPGTHIEGNTIENFYYMGCYNYYQEDIKVNGNSLTSNSAYTSMYGIYFYYANGEFELIGNHVYPTDGTDGFYMGAYISQGIGDDPFNRGTVANNIFIGGRAGETGTVYGMYTANASAKNFYHNTFLVLDGGTSARAFYASGNNASEYMNNIYAVLPIDSNSTYGQGYAAYYTSGVVFGLNHNNYYSGGSSPIYFNAAYADLQSYQNATSNDLNGHDVNPNFTDTINAILCNDILDGAGMAVGITTDFNDNMRNPNTPDIGAIEFQGVGTLSLGPDTTICGTESTLMVGAGGTVLWQDANSSTLSTGNSIVVNSTTAFPVSVSYTNSCGTANADVSLTFVPNVDLNATLHLCAGAEETLSPDGNGSPSATYAWFPNGEATAQLDVNAPGVYSVTKSEDGCVSQASVLVTQSEAITLVDAEACQTNLPYSVNATIANATSYTWSGGASTSTAQNDFTATGDYSITATDSFGCTSIDTFSLEVIDVPVAVISNDSHASNLFFLSSLASQNAGANATYFWTFGDGTTSTDANPSHLFPWNGSSQTFTVTLTITNDCGTSTTASIEITSDPLGINGIQNVSTLLVYPNPSNGLITVSGDFTSNNVSVEVLDLSGRLVKSISKASLANNQFELDLSSLARGSYQIKVVNGTDVQIAKVILN